MILERFYTLWTYMRWISVFIFIALFIAFSIYGHSWSLELEYVGPGSDADRLGRDVRDRDNRDSFDRVQQDTADTRDVERAVEYSRDHEV